MIKAFGKFYLFTFLSILVIAGVAPSAIAFGPEPPPEGFDDQTGPATVGTLTLTAVTPSVTTAMVVGHCGSQDVTYTLAFPGLGDPAQVGPEDIENFTFRVQGANLDNSGLRTCHKVNDPTITELWFIINTVPKVTHPASNVVVADVVILRLINKDER